MLELQLFNFEEAAVEVFLLGKITITPKPFFSLIFFNLSFLIYLKKIMSQSLSKFNNHLVIVPNPTCFTLVRKEAVTATFFPK